MIETFTFEPILSSSSRERKKEETFIFEHNDPCVLFRTICRHFSRSIYFLEIAILSCQEVWMDFEEIRTYKCLKFSLARI